MPGQFSLHSHFPVPGHHIHNALEFVLAAFLERQRKRDRKRERMRGVSGT